MQDDHLTDGKEETGGDLRAWRDYWGFDPIFRNHVKLFVTDLERAASVGDSGVYSLFGLHPFIFVSILGHIMELHQYPDSIKFLLEDGTGMIWCKKRKLDCNYYEYKIGDTLRIFGLLRMQQGNGRTIQVSDMIHIKEDPHAEILHWLEVLKLIREVYTKPFDFSQFQNKNSKIEIIRNKDPEFLLISPIIQYIKNEECTHISTSDVIKLKMDQVNIDQIIHLLISHGILCPSDQQSQEEQIYEVIGHHNLTPTIHQIISSFKGITGVSLQTILHKVKSNKKYQQVPQDRIISSLHFLVASSNIYPLQGSEVFRSFDSS